MRLLHARELIRERLHLSDELAALLDLAPEECAGHVLATVARREAIDRAIAATRIGSAGQERALAGAVDREQVALTLARLLRSAAERRPALTSLAALFAAFDLSGLVIRSVHDTLAAADPGAAQEFVIRAVEGLEPDLRARLGNEFGLQPADQDDVLQTVAVSLVRNGLGQYLALSSLRVYVGSIAAHAAVRLLRGRHPGLRGDLPAAQGLDTAAILDRILEPPIDWSVAYQQLSVVGEFLRDQGVDAALARLYREMMAPGLVANHPYPEPAAVWALMDRHILGETRLSSALVRAIRRLSAGRKRTIARLYFVKGVPVRAIRELLGLTADAQVTMPLKRAWQSLAADAELIRALAAIEAEATTLVPGPEPPDLPPDRGGRAPIDRRSDLPGSQASGQRGRTGPVPRPAGPRSINQMRFRLLSEHVLQACADLAMITEYPLPPGDLAPGFLARIVQRLDLETVLRCVTARSCTNALGIRPLPHDVTPAPAVRGTPEYVEPEREKGFPLK